MIRLTDEEFIEISNKYVGSPMAAQIATASAKLKKVVDFWDYYQTTMELALDESHTRFDIPTEKWQSLLKEIE